MTMNWKPGSLIFALATVFALSGCATTPNVHYVPKSPQQADKGVMVQIPGFEDGRSAVDKGVLGGNYNQYNARLSNITEPANMLPRLREAFISELTNSGYQVTAEPKDLVLKVTLESITCDVRAISQKSTITARIMLMDKGKEVLNDIYRNDATVGFSFDATGSDVLNKNIGELARKFAADLDQYITT